MCQLWAKPQPLTYQVSKKILLLSPPSLDLRISILEALQEVSHSIYLGSDLEANREYPEGNNVTNW